MAIKTFDDLNEAEINALDEGNEDLNDINFNSLMRELKDLEGDYAPSDSFLEDEYGQAQNTYW